MAHHVESLAAHRDSGATALQGRALAVGERSRRLASEQSAHIEGLLLAEIQRQRVSVKRSCERALSESSRAIALIHRDAKSAATRVGERAEDLRERSKLAARQLAESQKRLTSMRIQSIRAYRPDQVMSMGYSVVRDAEGVILRDARTAMASQFVNILFHDGEIIAAPQTRK